MPKTTFEPQDVHTSPIDSDRIAMPDLSGMANGDLHLITLGACGEIFGPNANLIIAGQNRILIDAGCVESSGRFMTDQMGRPIKNAAPDIRYFTGQNAPTAIVLTHGHRDHYAFIPQIANLLPDGLPIYGSPYALAMLAKELGEARRSRFRLISITPNAELLFDKNGNGSKPLRFMPIAVAHTTPQTLAFGISFGDNAILYTTDTKYLDDKAKLGGPITGDTDIAAMTDWVTRHQPALITMDVTNANTPGSVNSYESYRDSLRGIIRNTTGNVFVGNFARSPDAMVAAIELGQMYDRQVVYAGRAMGHALHVARELQLPGAEILNEMPHVGQVSLHSRQRLLAVVSGVGFEPGAFLSRLAEANLNPDANAKKLFGLQPCRGDSVALFGRIFDQARYAEKVAQLRGTGAATFEVQHARISGHMQQDNIIAALRYMHGISPQSQFMRIHGAEEQMAAFKNVAKSVRMGGRVITHGNGSWVRIADNRVAEQTKLPHCHYTWCWGRWHRLDVDRVPMYSAALLERNGGMTMTKIDGLQTWANPDFTAKYTHRSRIRIRTA